MKKDVNLQKDINKLMNIYFPDFVLSFLLINNYSCTMKITQTQACTYILTFIYQNCALSCMIALMIYVHGSVK